MFALGLGPNSETIDTLVRAYAEPNRHYHNWSHIAACLGHLDASIHLAARPLEVEVAIWFHDAIYNPYSRTNEERCAGMAGKWIAHNGGSQEMRERIERGIRLTRHEEPPSTPDEALLLDIDLAILGAEEPAYAAYAGAIRAEYGLLPAWYYNKQRGTVLTGFLNRKTIYHTPTYQSALESRARVNIATEMGALNSSASRATDRR